LNQELFWEKQKRFLKVPQDTLQLQKILLHC